MISEQEMFDAEWIHGYMLGAVNRTPAEIIQRKILVHRQRDRLPLSATATIHAATLELDALDQITCLNVAVERAMSPVNGGGVPECGE